MQFTISSVVVEATHTIRSNQSKGEALCKVVFLDTTSVVKLVRHDLKDEVQPEQRGKFEMTDSSHVWTPDLGDKLGHHLGDEIGDLKGAGIFSISLLAEEIRLNVLEDSM
ncbi:hypothetical protein AVEN_113994-1 [Araneus ventricosus]|uniref:Uncharacterized protein n=1 Tax=Araneus ventricosus TaxID=182803 RepID=A0A4Y2JY48_ARAVE|nr:hypothetical protein AVEN_113994-1 [Araneus ventricosus]